MTRTHSKSSRVLINASHLSGSITGYRAEHRRAYADVSSLLSDGDQFMPGQLGGLVAVDGLFDSGAGNISEVIDTAAATDAGLLVTIMPDGLAVGSLAFIADGNVSGRNLTAAVKDAVRLAVEGTPNDGVDWATVLHGLTAETADGDETSIDNTASSAGGGVAALHVTDYTGLTSISIRVQHSTDDSVWTDLVTFTSVTAETWEKQTVTGTVNQYVRAWWDVTGTGTCTFAVAFARR